MINTILENIKIKDIKLYEYNKIRLNNMLEYIYFYLDINEENIINFLNNNLSNHGQMINNKYIFTNIFYLYLLSLMKRKNIKIDEIAYSIKLFKEKFKININLILEMIPENVLIQKINDIYDKQGNLIYSKSKYINDLERNFQLIHSDGISAGERRFSESIMESYFEVIYKYLKYLIDWE